MRKIIVAMFCLTLAGCSVWTGNKGSPLRMSGCRIWPAIVDGGVAVGMGAASVAAHNDKLKADKQDMLKTGTMVLTGIMISSAVMGYGDYLNCEEIK